MTGAASHVARAGQALVRRVRSTLGDPVAQPAGARHSASGWVAVTVLCSQDDLDANAPPAPLAELKERVEVRVRPAADDKGTELAARLLDPTARASAPRRLGGKDPDAALRSALRRAKQLVEVGEVLAVDPAPHGERRSTPGDRFIEAWTDAAPRAGVR